MTKYLNLFKLHSITFRHINDFFRGLVKIMVWAKVTHLRGERGEFCRHGWNNNYSNVFCWPTLSVTLHPPLLPTNKTHDSFSHFSLCILNINICRFRGFLAENTDRWSCLQYIMNWFCYAEQESRLCSLVIPKGKNLKNTEERRIHHHDWQATTCFLTLQPIHIKKKKTRDVYLPYEPGLDCCHAFCDGGRVENIWMVMHADTFQSMPRLEILKLCVVLFLDVHRLSRLRRDECKLRHKIE